MNASLFSKIPPAAPGPKSKVSAQQTNAAVGGQLHPAVRELNAIFVHSRLDDYGLSPQQFRVYGHLARRDGKRGAFPSVREMAQVCQLHPQTVRRCLKVLAIHRLLTRQERSGTTPLYRLTPPSHWQPPTHIHGDPCEMNTAPSHSSIATPKAVQTAHSEIGTVKGNPLKGESKKEIHNPHSPPMGDDVKGGTSAGSGSPEETIYEAYPRKVGKSVALRAIRRALAKHSLDLLLERTRLFATTYNGPAEFIPHPSTWFRQERFNDDPTTWSRASTIKGGLKNRVPPARQFDREDYRQPLSKF